MIAKSNRLRPIPSFLLPFTHSAPFTQIRCLHHRIRIPRAPSPTPFVPDVQTFLTLIGRNLSQHASKIPSWNALFSLTSAQLRGLGIEPPRTRRYLLAWREKFRQGHFGIGGDLQSVKDGEALLSVVEVPRLGESAATATILPQKRRIVVNLGGSAEEVPAEQLKPVGGVRVKGRQTTHAIVGSHVQPLKGGKAAKIKIQEGLWEQRRGHKIDGGERRQAAVRAKRRAEEKKAR
jgi:hypothetical protein